MNHDHIRSGASRPAIRGIFYLRQRTKRIVNNDRLALDSFLAKDIREPCWRVVQAPVDFRQFGMIAYSLCLKLHPRSERIDILPLLLQSE